jgi:hypothetical protein
MSHRPTFEWAPPAYNLLDWDMLPEDVYEKPDFSISNGDIRRWDKWAIESFKLLKRIRNKPEAEITIYRASPKNELNPWDWITLSKEYAKQHALSNGTKVFSHKVKAKDIYFAWDYINEFWYFPKSQLEQIWKEAHKK